MSKGSVLRRARKDKAKTRAKHQRRSRSLSEDADRYGIKKPGKPCSSRQARALMDEVGFQRGEKTLVIRSANGSVRRIPVNIRNLQLIFSADHASALIRRYRENRVESFLKTEIAKRDVLGLGSKEIELALEEFRFLIAKFARLNFKGTLKEAENYKAKMKQYYGWN